MESIRTDWIEKWNRSEPIGSKNGIDPNRLDRKMESIRTDWIEKWNRSESTGSKKESNSNRNFGEPESKKTEPNWFSILALVSFYELIETYEEKESKTHSILSIRFLRFRVPEVSIPVRFFFRSHRFGSIPYSIPTNSDRFHIQFNDSNRFRIKNRNSIRLKSESVHP